MSRDLKFRAWNSVLKEMNEVTSLRMYKNNITGIVMSKVGVKNPIKEGWFNITKSDEIEKVILMQFTGLLDKKGIEIFEGDIIKYKRRWEPDMEKIEIGFIYFDAPSYWISLNEDRTHTTGIINILHADKITKCEVIGNIYENPELMK